MNWMFESRSKNWYDEDSDGEIYLPSLKWYEILLIPVVAVVLMRLVPYVSYSYWAMDFMKLPERLRKGCLEFPRLTMVGIFLTVILWPAHSKPGFEFRNHPFITYWSLIFIIYYTLAPLNRLVWQYFKKQ